MTKKLIALLLLLAMCLSLAACGGDASAEGKKPDAPAETTVDAPLAAALEEAAKDGSMINTSAWLMYSWLTRNLNDFKDPATVELTGNAYYCKDESSGDFKFFLMEIRANNSFGGKSVGYVKVTSTGIVETDWTPAKTSPTFEGEQVWKCGTLFMEDVFQEFMENNYK